MDYFEKINGPLIQSVSSSLSEDGFLLNQTIVMSTFNDVLEGMSDNINSSLIRVAKEGFLEDLKREIGTIDSLKDERDLSSIDDISRDYNLVMPFELKTVRVKKIIKKVLVRNRIENVARRRKQMCKVIHFLFKGTAKDISVNDFYLKVVNFERIMANEAFDSSDQKYFYVEQASNHQNVDTILVMQNKYQCNEVYNVIIKHFDEFRCWVLLATALSNSMFLGMHFFELATGMSSGDKSMDKLLSKSIMLRLYPQQIMVNVLKRLNVENTVRRLADFVRILQAREVSLTCFTTAASRLMQVTEIVLPRFSKERPEEVIPTTYQEVISILKKNKLADFTQNELLQIITRGIFFDRERLKITVPLSFLMPPYVEKSHFYGLSVILSHELFHSIDSVASRRINTGFVENQNLADISRKIVQKIQHISFDGIPLAPGKTKNEDLADYVGLHVAFEVSSNLTDSFFQEAFFEAYAKLFLVHLTISDQKEEILKSKHSPVFVRCNLQLSLLPSFQTWCRKTKVTPMFG
ncbi:hypothetical protein D8911_00835 [Levilactobacillus brevis]|nr:hypothetical protein D8911_00835 [Levilactobacillus brevis]